MKIGLLDSGIGGLNVLPEALRVLPHASFLYYADEDHVPYGRKTPDEIRSYALDAVSLLVERGAQAIVIACNTATSAAIADLRERYERPDRPPFIPIIGMEPALKRALDVCPNGRILVSATPVTIRGAKLKALREAHDHDHRADLIALPELVRFSESGQFDTPEVRSYLREVLSQFHLEDYTAFVLGCTHFPFCKSALRACLPDTVRLIDGTEGTVRQLVTRLQNECHLDTGTPASSLSPADEERVSFFVSGRTATAGEIVHFRSLLQQAERMEAIL